MSWDVLLMHLPAGAASIDDVAHDVRPSPLGPRDEVIARLREAFPDANFRDPSWGRLDGGPYSIAFNMGRTGVCESVMLHVRGGAAALDAVDRAIAALGCAAFDCQRGEAYSRAAAERSFGAWASFRDATTGTPPKRR